MLILLGGNALAFERPGPDLSPVGEWQWDNGRTVTVHEDGTADVFNPRTGAQESVGRWKQDEPGTIRFVWKNGDRHEMTLSDDGGALKGSLVRRGQTAGSLAFAERVQETPPSKDDEPEVAGYFGSTSPYGEPEPVAPPTGEETSLSQQTDLVPAAETADPTSNKETYVALQPDSARLAGGVRRETSTGPIGSWKEEGVVSWDVSHVEPGDYEILLEYSVGLGRHGGRFEIATDSTTKIGDVRSTGGWRAIRRESLGTVTIAGEDETLRLTATSVEAGAYLMNLHSLALRGK